MIRTQRTYIVCLVAFIICTFIFLQADSDTPGRLGLPIVSSYFSPALKKHKITIIAIWSVTKPDYPNYFPYFWQSVEANADHDVNLLFVEIDRAGYGCTTHSTASNVRQVCMTEDQYYELHVEFLCKKWECTADERETLFNSIKTEGRHDKNNSFFRILRNGIFEHFIDPDTTYWGWCDSDIFWGNFKRTFPWDLAGLFDIMAPANQPEYRLQRMLFTRGHMAFFRHSPDVLERMHAYPKFATLDAFLTLPKTVVDAEESEFSHFYFAEDESFTFVLFDGLLSSGDTSLITPGPSGGVFYTWRRPHATLNDDERKRTAELVREDRECPVTQTFTPQGNEKEAVVFKDATGYKSGLWFNPKWCVYVETGWETFEEQHSKAYLMRREPYGPVTQRLEPREPYLIANGNISVDECLYKHWQQEKYDQAWFNRIPYHIEKNQIFVQSGGEYAELWNGKGQTIRVI